MNEWRLRTVKTVHTLVWALFASCILVIPVMAWSGRFGVATLLTALVSVEVCVLAANRMRCPLTDVAARYTADRSPNFDIYLPLWLARHNKVIFGWLFLGGVLLLIARWQARPL